MRRLFAAVAVTLAAGTAVAVAGTPAYAHRVCDVEIRPCFCDGPVPPLHLQPC